MAGQPIRRARRAAQAAEQQAKPQQSGEVESPPWTRRDSRPPFEPGNLANLRHGARSDRIVARRAERVHAELEKVAPWLLTEPVFAVSVQRYLQAAAREQLLHDYIERMAAEKGVERIASRVFEQATAASRLAAKLADELGLSPLGHARLKAVAATAEIGAVTLADLAERGRQLREQRDRVDRAITSGDDAEPEQHDEHGV